MAAQLRRIGARVFLMSQRTISTNRRELVNALNVLAVPARRNRRLALAEQFALHQVELVRRQRAAFAQLLDLG